jgi:hypothetical protein
LVALVSNIQELQTIAIGQRELRRLGKFWSGFDDKRCVGYKCALRHATWEVFDYASTVLTYKVDQSYLGIFDDLYAWPP